MVMVKLKGIFKVQSKGRTYYYAWRGGPRLEGEPGSAEFVASYQEARNPLSKADKSRFSAWVTLYRASDEFAALADETRRIWQPWLDEVKAHFGPLSMRQFDRPKIRVAITQWRAKWKKTPRAADMGKQVLSRVLSFAVAQGAIQFNPCEGLPNLYHADRSDIIWTPDDLAAFCEAAPAEVAWAAKLAAQTGLRRGDLVKLAWTNISEYAIEIRTGKSRGRRSATVPLTAAARALLDTIPKRATTVLTSTRGLPWTADGFGTAWQRAFNASALAGRDLHLHDLRGTAATNYYRADFTIREIAGILGWAEDKVERLIDRYVKRDEILKDRIRRLEKAQK
jgi:integrase